MRPGRHEIRTVQALRGLACVLVVLYHAAEAWGAGQVPPRAADAVWPNGAAGVDLFFVISGFVMALTSAGLSGGADAWRFALRRVRRVVPLYWLMTGTKLALLAIVTPTLLPDLWHVGASLLFIPSRDVAGAVRPVLGVGWTLQFEVLFYGLFALALAYRRPAWRVVLPLLVPLAVAGLFRRPDWPAPLVLANGLVLEFCLGLGVAAGLRSSPPCSANRAACLFGVGLGLLLTMPQPGALRFALWGAPAAVMLAGAVQAEPWLCRRLPRWLLAAGEASYAIYLCHPFVVPVLARGVAAHASARLALPALLGASVLASVLAGLVLHRLVDQPVQRWLSARPRSGVRSAEPVAQLVHP